MIQPAQLWISKYALTRGIYKAEGFFTSSMKGYFFENYNGSDSGISKEFYHSTKEEAIKKAQTMRDERVRDLQKEIDLLKNLSFDN